MEVDEAVIDVDAHLENSSIDFFVRGEEREAHFLSHFAREEHNEFGDFLRLHLRTLVGAREILPSRLKVLKISLKSLQTVVIFEVVLLELLNDDEDEKIEHDIAHDHIEQEEEEWGDS